MLGRLGLSTLVLTSIAACIDLASEDEDASDLSNLEQQACVHDGLATLRRLNERYRNIDAALADGFELGVIVDCDRVVTGCVAHPTLGAMGYHYFKPDRFNDARIKELEPEALVYHTAGDGTLTLGAVEWVVSKPAWEAKHGVGAAPPKVYGHTLTVINPVLNWYVAHAWLWKKNPSGTFSDWNPNVTCP